MPFLFPCSSFLNIFFECQNIYINFRFGTYTFQNLKFHQQLLQITGALFPFTLFIPVFSSCSINSAKIREVKIEWTKQLVAQQKQKTERIKKETALQNAKLDAQRVKDVRTTFSFAKEHEIWKSRICGD